VRHFWDSELGRMFRASREQQRLDGEITLGEAQRVDVNNRIIAAQLAIVADARGERLGTVLMLRDVTRDALSDRLKDQFVTQMSHELRTPLTAIKGMSEVLLESRQDRPPNRKFLEAISRNVAVLDRMIVELLDISEIGAGSFAVRQNPVNLPELVFDVIQGHQIGLEKAELHLGVMVTNRERLIVTGDDRRLQWAIGHLIDNSIKYTEPGGEIVIRMGRVRDKHILLEVSDTGVGISPRDLPHVFERFYRGEARTPLGKVIDPRGLGQGLFVARAVAEAHGGYLSVASAVGEGSTFTFALPLEKDMRRELPPMPAGPNGDPPIPSFIEPPVETTLATQPHPAQKD
jgi:signal transduction histidine kinase